VAQKINKCIISSSLISEEISEEKESREAMRVAGIEAEKIEKS